ncbi:MAG: hypothetical protein HYV47_01675 [Candidatus Nealsonbacteria bacterium]|nr:hypothetical protein [Candidatus Nealsonbacteria bacterium]
MMNSVKKLIGLILLLAGLAIILYSLYSSYNIFTAKTSAPDIFKFEQVKATPNAQQGVEAQLQNLLQDQLKGLLPTDSIPGLLNLMSWSIFAGILIFGGGQIAGLGIKLLK